MDALVAVNSRELSANLAQFYDFTGKIVLYVGAGGAQPLIPDVRIKKVIAIDSSVEALEKFASNFGAKGRPECVSMVALAFESVMLSGDVVYFEFCLHEMADPYGALVHARALAPDIVVLDHLPDSDWSFYAAEEEKVRHSTKAIERLGSRRRVALQTDQRFTDYKELHGKVASQGAVAIERARHFASLTDIVIPLRYQLALL